MRCWLLVLLVGFAAGFPSEPNPEVAGNLAEEQAESGIDAGIEKARQFVWSCGDKEILSCLKMRALTYVDRALRRAEIDVTDGVALVRSGPVEGQRLGRALTEAELDASLPGDAEEKDAQVESLLVDRIARFLESFTMQFRMPEGAITEVRKSLDEARGKKKKIKMLLPILLLAKLKAAALIPLALGGLALLSFKALIVGKLALLLAGIIALQKLLGNKNTQTYEVVAHPHYSHSHVSSYGDDHGHYAARALPVDAAPVGDAQELAYNAYKPE